MNRSGELLARSLAAVWHPCTQMKAHETIPLVPVVRGEGLWLFDADGRRYFDAISSWWTNLFGHANPAINAALKDQLDRLEHVMLAGFTHPPVVELSERLSALAGGELGHAFYASDGASAVEIALKMSFHYRVNAGQPEKREFACLEGSYHGETMGALGVTDVPVFRDAYGPLVQAAHRVPSPDARRAAPGETAADVARRAAEGVEALFDEHAGRISALIVEPLVQCATGMAMHDPEYLRRIRALCDRYDVHLILDEIAVGFGRTGTMFAHEQAAAGDRPCRPDFLCLSKGISGGYLPLSVVLTTDRIYEAFYDDRVTRGFLHSHSYTGNPLACRAALATLDLLATDFAAGGPARRADWLKAAFAPLASHPRVRHLRQAGSILAFDVVDAAPDFARRCFAEGLQRELLIRPIGGTVYVMPPYLLSEQDADWLGRTVLATALAALGHAPAPQPQAILP
jgi:adenosylmethionine---8-amino-7-oxononanoate aminotransferase